MTAAQPISLKNVYGDLSDMQKKAVIPATNDAKGSPVPAHFDDPIADHHKRDYVGAVLADSAQKCDAFIGSLSAGQRANDAAFDIVTTALNAMATAFTPVNTIHALTAGATFTSGTRLAIDTDVYAKETAQLIAQAVDDTYYKQYATYAATLSQQDEIKIIPSVEVAKIKAFHKDCSLDRALVHIFGNQTKGPSPKPPMSVSDLKVGTLPALADGTVYVIEKLPGDGTVTYATYQPGSGKPSADQSAPADLFLKAISGQ
ncbi:hypothetical protein WS81_11195 [Burkholderia sp. MSMB2040]|nr:hypothetical protein WS81_11195 [Burkholderia sp. MSMB2040]